MFQVANLEHPNSLKNTIPLCVFDCQDNPANLQIALGMYTAQVHDLQSTITWKGKSFTVFFFGDYDYQCKSYGLSGPSGYRPCLHCLCPKKIRATPPHERPAEARQCRTLASLQQDHNRFITSGANISQAKHFNNAIRPIILPIPVCNVVIPALHLDLGIFPWIFDAFENETRLLDFKLAEASIPPTAADQPSFAELSHLHEQVKSAHRSMHTSQEKQDALQQQLQYVVLPFTACHHSCVKLGRYCCCGSGPVESRK